MTRLIIDGRVLSAPICGVGIFLYNVLKELSRRNTGLQVDVYCNKHYNPAYTDLTQLSNINFFSSQSFLFRNSIIWFLFYFQYKVLTAKNAIVWGPAAQLPLILKYGHTTVVTIHDCVNKDFKHTMSLKNRISDAVFTGRSIRNTDVVWTVSEYTLQRLKEIYPSLQSKRCFTGSSIDFDFYRNLNLSATEIKEIKERYHIEGHEKVVLFVGTIEPRKNLKFLLSLIPVLSQHGVRLIVVGGQGWLSSEINEISSKPDFPKDAVIFAGRISDLELRNLYNIADCFCMTSLNEGFGLPILEAAACGCKAVCANNSGMAEIGAGISTLVDGWNKEEWCRAILNTVENRDSRPDIKGNLSRFSWTEIIDRFLKAITAG